MQHRFVINLLVLLMAAASNWCQAADTPKCDSLADWLKDFDPVACQATDNHEMRCVYSVSFRNLNQDHFNMSQFLKIEHPLDMDILNPATMNFNTDGIPMKKNQHGEIISVDNRDYQISFEYKKENIGGKDYYTGLAVRFVPKEDNKESGTVKYSLKYQMTDGIPEARQLTIKHPSRGKVSFTKDRQMCPQTGKQENCLIASRDSSTDYTFEVNNPPLFEVYFYQKNSGALLPIGLKRFKNIGGEYKIIEMQIDGKTIKYEYYDDKSNNGAYYRKVKKATFPDNTTKSYEYFDDGCLKSIKSL